MESALSDDIEEEIDGTCWFIPKPRNATYLDDVTVGNRELELAWADALYTVARLAVKGLPLGTSKCTWLALTVTVLGVELACDEYCIGRKALGKLLASTLPRTLAQL